MNIKLLPSKQSPSWSSYISSTYFGNDDVLTTKFAPHQQEIPIHTYGDRSGNQDGVWSGQALPEERRSEVCGAGLIRLFRAAIRLSQKESQCRRWCVHVRDFDYLHLPIQYYYGFGVFGQITTHVHSFPVTRACSRWAVR